MLGKVFCGPDLNSSKVIIDHIRVSLTDSSHRVELAEPRKGAPEIIHKARARRPDMVDDHPAIIDGSDRGKLGLRKAATEVWLPLPVLQVSNV